MKKDKEKNKDDRKIVVYMRKSKYTQKGESIKNQYNACINKLKIEFPDLDEKNDVYAIEDEGFSGYSMQRPGMIELIDLINAKKVKILVFYRLDRLSRNVSEFNNFLQLLEKNHIEFMSATETLENRTPMGKAMIQITSVFAELERNTTAERIRDNMIGLAKTGRWLGGTTPTGYKSTGIEYIDDEGKARTLRKLEPIKKELDIIKLIYQKFLQYKSQSGVETYLLQNNIKTKNGKNYTRWSIKNILTNPVYAIADEDIYNYFLANNGDVIGSIKDYNGKYGLMVYNKTEQKMTSNKKSKIHEKKDIEDWIISIGKHRGIISGKDWVKAQNILVQNEDMRYRKESVSYALLSGILKCEHCDSWMRPKLKGKTVDEYGRRRFDYMCELKDHSRKTRCQCRNINGLEADDLALQTIKKLSTPNSKFRKILDQMSKGEFEEVNNIDSEKESLSKSLKETKREIESLVDKLSCIDSDVTLKKISDKIEKLDKERINIENEIAKINAKSKTDIINIDTANLLIDIMNNYYNNFETLDLNTKRNLIKILVSSITTDGNDITINLVGSRQVDETSIPTGENSK